MVIEYSDLPMEMQKLTDESGKLRYIAGSIAIHVLDREFVRRMARPQDRRTAAQLPLRPIRGPRFRFTGLTRKSRRWIESGQPVKPEKPNGVKFEMFVFDALPFAQESRRDRNEAGG